MILDIFYTFIMMFIKNITQIQRNSTRGKWAL